MACSSVNRTDLVKKWSDKETAPELQCRCALSDCKMMAACVSPCYLSGLTCCPRCGSHTL